ncbi:MAG: ADOP family duplicated permease [Candidatus Angelobacter sp.]
MSQFFRRVYYLLNRRRLQRELENDMLAHREMMSAELRRDFGNPALLRENSHAIWGWGWLERFFQDVLFGVRLFYKAPALTLTAIAVLALGIGVNVTAFNFVDIMFFRPLPVRDPHSLAHFTTQFNNGSSTVVAYPAAIFYRDHSDALASVIAQAGTQMTLSEREPQSLHISLATTNYLSDLGVSAVYGRVFAPHVDDTPDAAPVAMLSYGFFQRHFGSDPSVVNKTIRINQRPVTIIGVLPARFIELDPGGAEQEDDIWLLIDKEPYFVPDTKMLTSFDPADSGARVFGRFKPGITFRAGEQALLPLAAELEQLYPGKIHKGEHLRVSAGGYAAEFNAEDVPAFGLFAALVLLVLAVTCGNLGNLLLGHAVTREREISIRLSLGATRSRILRQLVTESFLLAMAGSGAALILSFYASRALLLIAGGPFLGFDVMPGWRTMVFALGLGILACVLFGLPAARQLSRERHRVSRVRSLFMATQVAASCVLLVVSALLVHALGRALHSDPGFDYAKVVAVDPQLYAHSYSSSAALGYIKDLKQRVLQAPGVEAAAMVLHPPLGNDITMGHGVSTDGSKFDIYYSEVDPDFFQVMSISLLRGRTFKPGEQGAAIVGESTARRLWPGKDALAQMYDFNRKKLPVVGVVSGAHIMALRDGDSGEVYLPIDEKKLTESVLLVKSTRPPEETAAIAGQLARSQDPQLSPIITTLKHAYDEKVTDSAKLTGVIGGMGALALILAAIGLYGVVSYNVGQRTKEIGIRMALGAAPKNVLGSILFKLLAPLSAAFAVGLVLAVALSFVLRNQLYGIDHLDPLSYLAAAVVLASVSGLAALIPARRATKVDPMIALRTE